MKDANFDKGMEIRKAVLGAEHVDASMRGADDFTLPAQELVTSFCWGAIWGREGLPRQTRSLINIAMLTALNRPHELKVHVRGAVNNGCTRTEIREVLLQAAVYCGFPAALDAFRSAREVLAAMEAERSDHPPA